MAPQTSQNRDSSATLDARPLDSRIHSSGQDKSNAGGEAQLTPSPPWPSATATNRSVTFEQASLRRRTEYFDFGRLTLEQDRRTSAAAAAENDLGHKRPVEENYEEDYEDGCEDDYKEYYGEYCEEGYEQEYYKGGFIKGKDTMKKVSPSDTTFEDILHDHQILMPRLGVYGLHTSPQNLDADRDCERLQWPRPAAEPMPRTVDDFATFTDKVGPMTEDTVTWFTFPSICGPAADVCELNLPCVNFASMTSNKATPPKPDYIEAACAGDIHPVLMHELQSLIIPSLQRERDKRLAAPNLAVEIKSARGCPLTALRQACLDGAYGARALRALARWGRGDDYDDDGQVYAYSATYHNSNALLELYSHSVEVLADGAPRYRMIRLATIVLSTNIDELRRGVTAFRNLRDMAAERRDAIIQAANARAAAGVGAKM